MPSEQKDLTNTKTRKIKRILRNWPACLVCKEPVKNVGKRFCQKHKGYANTVMYRGVKPILVDVIEYHPKGDKELELE